MTDDEREAVRRLVVATNMDCKAEAPRYNFSPLERLRFRQAAEYIRTDSALIKELKAALRPFAKAGELFKGAAPAEFDQRIYAPAAGDEWAISGDDLRRARDVLNAARERQGG